MARIYSHRKGKSHSMRPPSKRFPPWVNYSVDEVEALIVKLSKDEISPSQIGIRLRDEYNIPLVKPVIGKSIRKVLEENNLNSQIPEDLAGLLTRAKKLQDHLKTNKGDRKNVRSLELLESKIHRLHKYYKGIGRLPSNWKYSNVVAQLA